MGRVHEALCCKPNMMVVLRSSSCVMELRAQLVCFSQTGAQTVVIQSRMIADILSKINQMNLSLQGKQITALDANHKILSFQRQI